MITLFLLLTLIQSDSNLLLAEAASSGNVAGMKAAIASGADLQSSDPLRGYSPIHYAILSGSADAVAFLLKLGCDPEFANGRGDNALQMALRLGVTSVVGTIIDAGAYLDTLNGEGDTNLMIAARVGFIESIDLLLKAGADVNQPNQSGETALMTAAQGIRIACLNRLIGAEAQLDQTDTKGMTALMHANSIKMVKALIKAGANVNKQVKQGPHALTLAYKRGELETFDLLIANGADLNCRDEFGWSLVMIGRLNSDENLLARLQDNGSRSFEPSDDWLVTLHFASSIGDQKLLKRALKKADIEHGDVLGQTALFYATNHSQGEIVKLLLNKGANPNHQDLAGDTALMLAVRLNQLDQVKILVEAGADFDLKNKAQQSASELAVAIRRASEIATFFTQRRRDTLHD